MRMWLVNPEYMCNEHLQREYWETQQLVDMLRGEWDISDLTMVKKLFGHVSRGQVFPSAIFGRTLELVKEMDGRGIHSHNGPIEYELDIPVNDTINPAILNHNQDVLFNRCDKCGVHR